MDPAHKERELARSVQERTYPSFIPTVAGFEIAAATRPADLNNGDFYDAIGVTPRSEGPGFVLDRSRQVDHLVLALGDATGHGMAAALMSTELRAMLRASIRLGVYHRDLLRAVNSQLSEDLSDSHFITLLLGRLIAEKRIFRWVSFGQGPVWHFHAADRSIETLMPHRPPLGILPDIDDYAPTETRLEPGDVLLALSDGFPESHNAAGELLGDAPLSKCLQRLAGAPLDQLLDGLWEDEARHRAGTLPRDGRTVIAIRRLQP